MLSSKCVALLNHPTAHDIQYNILILVTITLRKCLTYLKKKKKKKACLINENTSRYGMYIHMLNYCIYHSHVMNISTVEWCIM